MNKRIWALAAILCMAPASVQASGLEVTEKNFIEFAGENTAYFFAKVENTGSSTIYPDSGKLVGFSSNDDIVISEDYVTTQPSRLALAPGEYVYVENYIFDTALETSDVSDYKFSLEAEDSGYSFEQIPCEVTTEFHGENDNYIIVTFSNDTDEILYDFYVTVALYDSSNHLIFADGDSTPVFGIHPGSTVSIKMYVENALFDYYQANNIQPGMADALVYKFIE